MLKVRTDITIGNYRFDFVGSIEINSSWENLTDTCKIIMPRKMRLKKDGVFTDAITSGEVGLWKRTDPVKVSLGYDDNTALRFEGVIMRIHTRTPLEFTCEDNMFGLKQKTIDKYSTRTKYPNKKQVSIKTILEDICPIPFIAEDITISDFSITRATVAEALDYFKRNFGLSSYILPDGKLYVGFAYRLETVVKDANTPVFQFQGNIIDDANLDYIREDDVLLKARAVNVKADNTRIEEVVGDPSGEERTLYFYNVKDSDLVKLAQEQLSKLKYEGFRGSFTTFLEPVIRHGDVIQLQDNLLPDRNGYYLVRRVVTTLSVENGGRQEITVDRKV